MPIIDPNALNNVTQGDDELLADLATMFVQFLPDMEARLRLAVESDDADTLRETAHQLRGRAGYFAAGSVVDLASKLEHNGRRGELKKAGELLDDLLVQVNEMVEELRSYTKLSLEIAEE